MLVFVLQAVYATLYEIFGFTHLLPSCVHCSGGVTVHLIFFELEYLKNETILVI